MGEGKWQQSPMVNFLSFTISVSMQLADLLVKSSDRLPENPCWGAL